MYYGGRCSNVSPPVLIPLLYLPYTAAACVEEEGAREGNFSIAEAVRQRTGERENKSAPLVSGDHPRQGNSAERQSE